MLNATINAMDNQRRSVYATLYNQCLFQLLELTYKNEANICLAGTFHMKKSLALIV
jgi:hypothetical protein